jgi:RNAse (barnase) inhibitor barstar
MASEFMTVDTMKNILSILKQYFLDNYKRPLVIDSNIKQSVFKMMKEVEEGFNGSSKDKSKKVLHMILKTINMSNEVDLPYPDRPQPMILEKMDLNNHKRESFEPPAPPKLETVHKPFNEVTITEDDFKKQLESIQAARDSLLKEGSVVESFAGAPVNDTEVEKPNEITVPIPEITVPEITVPIPEITVPIPAEEPALVVPIKQQLSKNSRHQTRYLLLNSIDRIGSLTNTNRFSFRISVDLTNVHSVAMTNLTLPIAYMEESDALSDVTKKVIDMPYVLVIVNELGSAYEGSNDAINRSFCQMQVQEYFQRSNGRGCAIMRPVQEERKIYFPELSKLSHLSIEIRDPNGFPIDDARDVLEIVSVEPISSGELIQVVTSGYFSISELSVGDRVHTKGIALPDCPLVHAHLERPEGHIVRELLDQEMSYMMYQSFTIDAPYTTVITNIGVEREYNIDDVFQSTKSTSGQIVNESMQVSASFTVERSSGYRT